jgi:chemotaxis protein CheX
MTAGIALPNAEDICILVSDVWASFLDSEIFPDAGATTPDAAKHNEVLSSVSISGAWSGHLLLGFEASAANEVARAMFGLGSDQASQDEVTDAVGELANIIAGNVKSMLPEPSTLSLPQVVLDAQTIALPAADIRLSAELSWGEHSVVVSLWEAVSDQERTSSCG